MNLYEKQIDKELLLWHKDIIKRAGLIERASGGIQVQTRKIVPKKVQNLITTSVETLTKTVLYGSELLSITDETGDLSLAERDYLVLNQFQSYRRTATLQGVGFGMGGVLLSAIDLPVLMSIKIKFMFDAAKLYGYNPEDMEERLFLLYIFQLAFSGRDYALHIFRKLESWDETVHPPIDWESLQIEYRDYLDFAKLLQLLPVVGSVAGGTANHKLMNRLCKTLMNSYRMRILGRKLHSP